MILIRAFIISGLFCMIAQIILDNSKLTPGHITSLFTILGALLSFLGVYDKIIDFAGAGATVLISNFGHMLYTSGLLGLKENGILGLFSTLLCSSSVAIVSAIVFSTVLAIIFKPKS